MPQHLALTWFLFLINKRRWQILERFYGAHVLFDSQADPNLKIISLIIHYIHSLKTF